MTSISPRICLSVFALLAALVTQSVHAQSVITILNIPGIPGESAIDKHGNQIDIQSFSLGVKGPVAMESGRAARVGAPQFAPVTILKRPDAATTVLFLACATGRVLPTAEIFVLKNVETKPLFLKITLSDVTVASFNPETVTVDTSSELVETLALGYSKIKIEYTKQDPSGKPGEHFEAVFDLATGKAP